MPGAAVAEQAAPRLDQFLTARYADRSRAEVQRWIKEGRVHVDGVRGKPGLRVEPGMSIAVDLPDAPPLADAFLAEAIPVTILYQDDDIIVVDKPAGLVVHPAPGHADGTLVNALLYHVPEIEGVGGARRPGIVHRLDKETSGLIVIARNERAHRMLQAQFAARSVYKEYIALVEGGVEPPEGIISAPVGRHPVDRKRQAVLPENSQGRTSGREAVTEYHTIHRYHAHARGASGLQTFTLLRVILHTGRTHQIRVHLAWRRHPVIGDTLYGPKTPRLPLGRHFLHAHKLTLHLPSTGEAMTFIAPIPAELQALIDKFEAD
jgi:23S rRNA pseudouridine1911/1915/1917 synthase